ncbi:MAG: 30S ribosome-binding factor RbfA [Sandaracinaceae bacterium]|nr:30S ribosome-binding factor RbfA [Sandaracinaceae bacterium]
MKDDKRTARVAARIQEELSSLLLRQVQDPRVRGALVTSVSVTPDLLDARIRVRLSTGDDAAARKALLAGLNSASGLLRRELGQRLALRHAPRLAFHYDESAEKTRRIEEVLAEIEKEPKAQDDE